jgi:hypothetical protein
VSTRQGIGAKPPEAKLTCSKYLRELERLGVLQDQRIGREAYFINRAVFEHLTR